jgi:hypothetical protein
VAAPSRLLGSMTSRRTGSLEDALRAVAALLAALPSPAMIWRCASDRRPRTCPWPLPRALTARRAFAGCCGMSGTASVHDGRAPPLAAGETVRAGRP